jgi:hypothetical protein
MVTIDPLTAPAEVALSVVAVADAALATGESKRRKKTNAEAISRARLLRVVETRGQSSSAKINNLRCFRESNIYFLEYFIWTPKRD